MSTARSVLAPAQTPGVCQVRKQRQVGDRFTADPTRTDPEGDDPFVTSGLVHGDHMLTDQEVVRDIYGYRKSSY